MIMKITNKRILSTMLILQLLFGVFFSFSLPALAWMKFSKEKKKRLEELGEVSKPAISVFGKINEPLKAGVSVLQYNPQTIDVQPIQPSMDIIKLSLSGNKKNNLSELESKRQELQKAEEEGLNFIQPSLQLSEEEQKAINEFFSRTEQEQLLNLWKATIERNKTIQFIIQKLTPAASPQQANSLLSKTIGAAIFLPFYALQAFTNNAASYYGSQVGGRVLGSVIEGKMKKNHTEMQLSQTEAIILFMMIDEVSERLRQRYHAYKKLMIERVLASGELNEVRKDSLDAHDSNTPGVEILSNIQRRSVEREIRRLDSEMRSQKSALIELAGPAAVNDLDEQLKVELAATSNTPLDFVGVEDK
ncbi:MAG: hypothetical protein HY094_00345 [Candidatus Melainabacteria bacterium]|nr:hypothetical protein [Candidatus Melainabacteria bacterium]